MHGQQNVKILQCVCGFVPHNGNISDNYKINMAIETDINYVHIAEFIFCHVTGILNYILL